MKYESMMTNIEVLPIEEIKLKGWMYNPEIATASLHIHWEYITTLQPQS